MIRSSSCPTVISAFSFSFYALTLLPFPYGYQFLDVHQLLLIEVALRLQILDLRLSGNQHTHF